MEKANNMNNNINIKGPPSFTQFINGSVIDILREHGYKMISTYVYNKDNINVYIGSIQYSEFIDNMAYSFHNTLDGDLESCDIVTVKTYEQLYSNIQAMDRDNTLSVLLEED